MSLDAPHVAVLTSPCVDRDLLYGITVSVGGTWSSMSFQSRSYDSELARRLPGDMNKAAGEVRVGTPDPLAGS